jgi:hypothetical protein
MKNIIYKNRYHLASLRFSKLEVLLLKKRLLKPLQNCRRTVSAECSEPYNFNYSLIYFIQVKECLKYIILKMLTRSLLKRMSSEERSYIREGAMFTALFTGLFGYFNYREYIKKDFLRSEGHYRFQQRTQNMTPWKQLYFTWWRMPEEEYDVYHRFKPYFIVGQIDYTKEVLIPRTKFINGMKMKGYDVINPVYCYEGGKMSFKDLFNKVDPVTIDRAALIVNRGWIPAELKDKRSRPNEINSRKLVKFRGVYRRGKDIHDYKVPNNPDNNEWHNLALEDIALYWELPNFDEVKHYYFQCVDLDHGSASTESHNQLFPIAMNPDEVIEDNYKWKVD